MDVTPCDQTVEQQLLSDCKLEHKVLQRTCRGTSPNAHSQTRDLCERLFDAISKGEVKEAKQVLCDPLLHNATAVSMMGLLMHATLSHLVAQEGHAAAATSGVATPLITDAVDLCVHHCEVVDVCGDDRHDDDCESNE